jgi:parvulin-like peptidyl-prolyl isomerase
VNGVPLSESAFARFVTVKLGAFADEPLNDTVRSELLDEFVERQLTVQAALDRGLRAPQPGETSNPAADVVLSEQAIDSLVDTYYREYVLKDVRVTPEEVSAYFDRNRSSYEDMASEVTVREILVRTREDADRALRSVESGCDFADVARAVSLGSTAASGGLARYDTKSLPPVFARAIAPLGDGQTSQVVHSDLGYHIFRVERRGQAPVLERVRDRVAGDVLARKNERLVEADVERLLGSAEVTINRSRLPFQYEGRFAH